MENFGIGKTIRELRIEHQYSQAQLGEFLNLSDSAISKWESGDVTPDIDQTNKLAKLFGLTVDALIHFQEHKNAEQIRLAAEEKTRQAEKNRLVKEKLKKCIYRNIWDKQQEYNQGESCIATDYDGTTLTLYQNENPNIVLYDGCIGSNTGISSTCSVLKHGKWEQCSAFKDYTDKWSILFDFDDPIERIRFSFSEKGIEDYEFFVKYVRADKEAYHKKLEEQKSEEESKIVNIQVFQSKPENGPRIINIIFNPLSDEFSYGAIELYSQTQNGEMCTQNLLKTYRLNQGEKIWMEDKICAYGLYFILKQYDNADHMIFKSKMIILSQ